MPLFGNNEGDRTVTVPTPVSNEEAVQGQDEWNAYNDALKQQRRTAIEKTGGGCSLVVLPFLLIAASSVVGIVGRLCG